MPPVPSATSATSFPRLDDLQPDEILRLLAGRDAWHLEGVERLQVPPLQVADCGHGVTLVAPPYGCATCFPTSVGMAATWNRGLLEEVGAALGREARAKGCQILLGPMVNLHRLPAGGRNYETFSEDPVLTARLAAAWVRGIQSEGTGACVKSFACNNQQTRQKYTSSEVDPRPLRELYLAVYRLIFEEVQPWAVMTSYNPVNGAHPADSRYWLEDVLRGELGFTGTVVSDWHAVQGDTALASGLDLEMPGPGRVLHAARLQAALAEGLLGWDDIRRRAGRVWELHRRAAATRLGQFPASPPEIDSERHRALARRVAEESIVLLQNEGSLLPLAPARLRRVAVIGPNSASARLGGGGSASVLPFFSVSPLAGLRQALPESVEVVHAEGCGLGEDFPIVPTGAWRRGIAADSAPGLEVGYFTVEAWEAGGPPGARVVEPTIDASWGWAAPAHGLPRHLFCARWSGCLVPPQDGPCTLHLSTREGLGRLWLGDELVIDLWSDFQPAVFEDRFTNRRGQVTFEGVAGKAQPITVEYRKTGAKAGIRLGWEPPGGADSVAEAASLAASADVAILCVGLSNLYEGGNCDRASHALPGRQVELIREVARSQPRTIVVLVHGTPVEVESWRNAVPAILTAHYPGQDGGTALARVLLGDVNPSGRLPDTWPRSWDDVPAMQHFPGDGARAPYAEGLLVGYRAHDRLGRPPSFPFGFGLGYSEFTFGHPVLSSEPIGPHAPATLRVRVANTGLRPGRAVVQVYLEPDGAGPDEPVRTLLDFAKVELAPGASAELAFPIVHRHLLSFDADTLAWTLRHPTGRLRVGPHAGAGEAVAYVCRNVD